MATARRRSKRNAKKRQRVAKRRPKPARKKRNERRSPLRREPKPPAPTQHADQVRLRAFVHDVRNALAGGLSLLECGIDELGNPNPNVQQTRADLRIVLEATRRIGQLVRIFAAGESPLERPTS